MRVFSLSEVSKICGGVVEASRLAQWISRGFVKPTRPSARSGYGLPVALRVAVIGDLCAHGMPVSHAANCIPVALEDLLVRVGSWEGPVTPQQAENLLKLRLMVAQEIHFGVQPSISVFAEIYDDLDLLLERLRATRGAEGQAVFVIDVGVVILGAMGRADALWNGRELGARGNTPPREAGVLLAAPAPVHAEAEA